MKRHSFEGIPVVIGSLIMQLSLGALYAWSTFSASLKEVYGLTASQASTIFGVAVITFTVTMIPGGRGVARYGPRRMAMVGALLFISGYFTASVAQGKYLYLLLGCGLMAGTGIGCFYTAPLAACLAWYPHRKGLMTGLAVAGFGAGSLILSTWAERLLEHGWDVHDVLRVVALVNGSCALIGAALLRLPKTSTSGSSLPQESKAMQLRQLVRLRSFQAAVCGMFAATFGGLLVIGNLKSLGLSYGLPSAVAGLAVGIFAIGNAIGRLFWGTVFDRLGRWTLVLTLLIQALVLFGMSAATDPTTFKILSFSCGFLFGAAFVLYAADLASEFGHGAIATVYPWVFLAYGIAGIAGPYVGGKTYDLTGSFAYACIFAGLISLLGATGYLLFHYDWVREQLRTLSQGVAEPD